MPIVVQREQLTAGYIKVTRLRLRLDDGEEVFREVESHGAAVAVLPYDPDRRQALIVKLFRAPVFVEAGIEAMEEVCAGMIEDGSAEDAARREAAEELGVTLTDLERVAKVWPSPGVSTETTELYLARYTPADRFGPGGGLASEHENITVIERSLGQLAADADAGHIADAKLLTLVLAMRLRHPELFGGGT